MSRLQANLVLLLTALIWGTAFVAQKEGMRDVGPFLFTAARFLLGGLAVLPLGLLEYRRLRARGGRLGASGAGWFLATGSVLFVAAVMQQVGITTTTVTNAGFLTALYVPLVPFLLLVVLRRATHWSAWPASLGCLAGAWLLGGGSLVALSGGDLWIIGGAFFWAVHVLLVEAMAKRTGTPILGATAQFLVCALLAAVAVAVAGEPVTAQGLTAAGGEILYAGLVSVGMGYTLQVVGQRFTQSADAAIMMSTESVFAALAGALILGERLALVELTGGALILAGVLAVHLLPRIRTGPGSDPR